MENEARFVDILQQYLAERGIEDKLYAFLENNCSGLQASTSQMKDLWILILYWILTFVNSQVPDDESEEQPLDLFTKYQGFTEV